MSKFSKLVDNPNGFFADYIKKKGNNSLVGDIVKKSSILNDFIKKNSTVKKIVKPPVKNLASSVNPLAKVNPNPINLKYHVNFFKKHTTILHTGEGLKAGLAHLKLWIPSFLESDINFVILVRDISLFSALKEEYPWINIAYAKRPIDIEDLIVKLPFVNDIFYPSSTGNNIHLVRFSYFNHIFIGHGDSDKASSAHKGLRLYDEIWTAGQAHIDRFFNAEFSSKHITFKKVGRPNSYKIINNCQLDWKQRKNRILYLPTWEGFMEEANYSSIHISPQILELISSKFNTHISAKYHPLTGNRAVAYQNMEQQLRSNFPEQIDNITIVDKSSTTDFVLSNNNIFICDMSAVISECLAANGPIFVYIPKDKVLNIAASNMRYEDYCYAFSDVTELEKSLNEVLSGNDYLAVKRKEAIDYLIGYNETLDKRFIKELSNLSSKVSTTLPSRFFDF